MDAMNLSMFHHLALPECLPHSEDADLDDIEVGLIDQLLAAARVMQDSNRCEPNPKPQSQPSAVWTSIRRCLAVSKAINRCGKVNREKLLSELRSMPATDPLILHIRSQNAALLIYRLSGSSDEVIFEVFEAAARNKDVLASNNALLWDFPGGAFALPLSTFTDDDFRASLASFLEQASLGSTKAFAAHTFKAGAETHEYRDTADPTVISSVLMAILEENGRRISTPLLRKRVRDDVCWTSGKPWRRSPLWLALRVSIARYLSLSIGPELGRFQYKFLLSVCLAMFLQAAQPSLQVDQIHFLKAKLCRRLVKLDIARDAVEDQELLGKVDSLFSHLAPMINDVIKGAAHAVQASWEEFKQASTKTIQLLPKKASPSETRLQLRVSGDRLRRMQTNSKAMMTAREPKTGLPRGAELPHATNEHFAMFARPYFQIIEKEDVLDPPDLSAHIRRLIEMGLPLYRGDVYQVSLLILDVMESWMRLDEDACRQFPLLRKYHPLFTPGVMDILRLARFKDMVRLQVIQSYLYDRIRACRGSRITVFDDPTSDCFARRYYDECPAAGPMRVLRETIEKTAEEQKRGKRAEWERKRQTYEHLTRVVNESTCISVVDENDPLGRPIHVEHMCTRCWTIRRLSHLRIQIHEHPLPTEDFMAKVVSFELMCPPYFAAYRDTTWMVFSQLASGPVAKSQPKCVLFEYPPLTEFHGSSRPGLTLGSLTKSFLKTHYAYMQFPVEWDGLCKPNGLHLAYFDSSSGIWSGRCRGRPQFSHLLELRFPPNSPLQSFHREGNFSVGGNGPSSYDIMATQRSCPSGLNPHEFLALKTLMSGSARRWISILVELGSTNLNWSSDTTRALLEHLALLCGPPSAENDPLRLVHSVFRDTHFVERLLEQVHSRLSALAALGSWREATQMGIMITLALRILDFADAVGLGTEIREKAVDAVTQARNICIRWCRVIQEEIQSCRDTNAAQQLQQRALAAALLCRRTAVLHLDHDVAFDSSSLAAYVESSIVIQENLATEIRSLSQTMLQDLVFAVKLSYRLKTSIASTIHRFQDGFRDAVKQFWPGADRIGLGNSTITTERGDLVRCDIAGTEFENCQVVHFDLLLGTLLVDGKPVGKLPQDLRNSLAIKELFKDQPLRVYQSSVPGMMYTLTHRPNKYAVHIGYDGSEMVIVARAPTTQLRFVPRDTFSDENTCDLPGPLVDKGIHWLDLDQGIVFFASLANPWAINNQTWRLNIHTGECWRLRGDNYYREDLIDPYSGLFHRFAKQLEALSPRRELLVVQPEKPGSNLEAHNKQLNLMFFVGRNKLLYSPQLKLEIDPSQDAGTWYGLINKLVCRNVENPFRRTVLVPLGELAAKRWGCHVSLTVKCMDRYGKFTINDILGRIDCAAEPMLVYTKALLHAYTSFILPDPLTGRTGAEESLHWLRSGICRPWAVLGPEVSALHQIAKLTPAREYYPPGLKFMKADRWDRRLTCHIQHPLYRQVVEEILAVSRDLQVFTTKRDVQGQVSYHLPAGGEMGLAMRALIRRQLYERRTAVNDGRSQADAADRVYLSRDKSSTSDARYAKVLQITHLLRTKPERFKTPPNLAAILAQGSTIGGYGAEYDTVAISDRMLDDIRENWGPLVEYCRAGRSSYDLMFLFAPLAFRKNIDDGILEALIAFAAFDDLQSLPLPPWPSYLNFSPESSPQLDDLARLILPFRTPAPMDEAERAGSRLTLNHRRRIQNAMEIHEVRSEEHCRYLAKSLLLQWPCPDPSTPKLPRSDLSVDIDAAVDGIKPEWTRLYHNREFALHLEEVQKILNRHHSQLEYSPPNTVAGGDVFPRPEPFLGREIPALGSQLLAKPFKPDLPPATRSFPSSSLADPYRRQISSVPIGSTGSRNDGGRLLPRDRLPNEDWVPLASIPRDGRLSPIGMVNREAVASNAKPKVSPEERRRYIEELGHIVNDLAKSKSLVRQNYAHDLSRSLETFSHLDANHLPNPFLNLRDHSFAKSEISRAFAPLKSSMERETRDMSSRQIQWLKLGGLWPAVTTVTLLEQLRSSPPFGNGMRQAIISFGVAITKLQREMRLNDCVLAGDTSRFQVEEDNVGHSNWKPEDHPGWLLLEIESNLLIRPGQVDVALATISPATGENSVLQMNMGQGKTSCVIPMVAASMADKKRLVRIIVPKALLLQTAQLMSSRLGGMLNRHIAHIPFSRRTPTDERTIRLYYEMHFRALKEAGVMLCVPEHNLSFMLSGQQRIVDNKLDEAKLMVGMHSWLRSVCRDILDESDYTLAARTQLIYPSGSQMSVDGHPHRWQVAQAILSLVDRHLYGLATSFPRSIEVVRRPGGGFPLIYFLRRDVEDQLLRRLATDICKGFGGILPVDSFNGRERAAVWDFLWPGSCRLKSTTLETIRSLRPDRPQVQQTVYLLRGLFFNRILMMTLKKRWNVQYGLRPNSDPVAVPYHAKGVPSEQSEWGHPDVAILFTCLVFYYDGVSQSQLRQALARVLKSDDPSTEYDKWVDCDGFPASLRQWNTINVEDNAQVFEIWKAVRYRVVVIDYFLNNFVFPPHAKQFKAKLQSSGWDIPLFSAEAPPKKGLRPLTTGFSGTNDNRTLLPLTIQQADLRGLSHTNAEVLTYLLHERSRRCVIMADVRGRRITERDLLHMLKRNNIKILIDAGAQVLEMDNETLARTWLDIDGRCAAALYFDSANRPWIVSKEGRKTPLLASPYADDLNKCLVYLDEAHTRGTDLKFPLDARGALTVGQGQSKDHTVQAAMRLRQLGTSQSITFFIPPEVHQVILDLRRKSTRDIIDSNDVICWLLNNSCDSIEQLQPLYYSQGMDFCRRTQAAIDNPNYLTDADHRTKYVESIMQNELQTLQEMYEPKAKGTSKQGELKSSHPKVATFLEELHHRRKAFQDTGAAVHGSALQEVEQEREVAIEVEAVRQVKQPVLYKALSFPGLHPDLKLFARTGLLPVASQTVSHVFSLLATTALGRKHKVSSTGNHAPSKLFVSAEFGRTVELRKHLTRDNFLRPVSWVLWSSLAETAVVLIPEEAEEVIRMMHAKTTLPEMYLITYASPVTRRMLSFNNLTFFSMPRLPEGWSAPQWLKTELGLLAGRVYFEWDEYESLCQFLGVNVNDESSLGWPMVEEKEEEKEGNADIPGSDDGHAAYDETRAAEEEQEEESNPDTPRNDDDHPADKLAKVADEATSAAEAPTSNLGSFCPHPVNFLQEWLAIRRHGQDFVHTPMGFLAQGKPLQASHPFFADADTTASPVVEDGPARTGVGLGNASGSGRVETGDVDDGGLFDGVDDMGANEGDEDDGEDDEDVYDDSEEEFVSELSGAETDSE